MRRTALIAGSIVATVAAPGPASADVESMNAILSGNLSATDNAFASNGDKQPDIYAQIRPGLLFGYATPRASYSASTEAEFLDYVIHYKQLALNVRASGSASFVVTRETDLGFSLNASTGKLNALSGRQTPDQSTTTLVPSGAGDIYQLDGGESSNHTLSPSLRIGQTAGVNFVQTNGNGGAISRSEQANFGLGANKAIEDNAFGLELGVGYGRFLQFNPGDPNNGIPSSGRLDRQILPRAGIGWRHDLTRKWSTSLGVGIAGILPVGTDPYDPTRDTSHRYWSPTGSGSLSYVDTWGFANIVASHGVTPNLLIAQNTIADSVSVNVAIPLAFIESRAQPPRYTLDGSTGYTHQRLVDTATSSTQGTFSGEHLDLGVGYIPRPSQVFALRYSLAHQTGDPTAVISIPSVTTNTISFTFSLRWPERILVPPPKKKSVRADESDLKGDEPAPIDPGMGGNANPKPDE